MQKINKNYLFFLKMQLSAIKSIKQKKSKKAIYFLSNNPIYHLSAEPFVSLKHKQTITLSNLKLTNP